MILMIFPTSFFAQEKAGGVNLFVEKNLKHIQNQNIINTVVKVENKTSVEFSGYLNIPEIKGLRNISKSTTPLKISPSDSTFIPVKFLIQPNMDAGTTSLVFNLLDGDRNIIRSNEASFVMDERVSLGLQTENNNIFITNQRDSIYIRATVVNSGNKAQKVTIVFSLPTLMGSVNFVEQTAQIEPAQQHTFVLAFLPTKGLLEQEQFTVNITGMRGLKKDLFGNSIVHINNVLPEKQYSETGFSADQFIFSQDNSIAARYRFLGAQNRILQLSGSGNIDLSAGYMELMGNIYKSNTDNNVIATNTYAKYRLFNNEVTLGNIYESLETTVSGRGAKVLFEDDKQKSVQVGIVDENYNLFSTNPLFSEGYSAYAIGKIKNTSYFGNVSSSYVYQYNPRERTNNNIVGGETNWLLKNWDITLALHGAVSKVKDSNESKSSGSSELRYRGKINTIDLSGVYFYSTDYFPGNRRGMAYIQQMFYKELKKGYSFMANILYTEFAPKFFSMSKDSKSGYFNGDIELFTPKIQHIYASIAYQTKNESSNSYKQNNYRTARMDSHRLKEYIRWNIPSSKHSIIFTQENGFAYYPSSKDPKLQLRSSLTYSYDWINIIGSYQSGSYYLSEYYLSQRENKSFNRLILSAMVNKGFSSNKYFINGGISLTNDPFSNLALSAYSNVKYTLSSKSSLYLNTSWNSYKLNSSTTSNIYSIELGVSINFPSKKLSSKRKSRINAFVFYDRNSNGTFDAGDTEATNYRVKINNQSFISPGNGMITYKGVPYGTYKVDQVSENGWFFDGDTIKADKSNVIALVPLQQAGTIVGRIRYAYDPESSIEITPQLSGIAFTIKNKEHKVVQKILTDGEGDFATFLPTGEYIIELVQSTLPQGAFCDSSERQVKINTGKIVNLKIFEIGVRHKKVNMKYFSQ